MTRNDADGSNRNHQADGEESTFDKVVKKTSEMLSGSDEGWESAGKNDTREVTDTQNAPDEGAGDVPTEDKVIRDPQTGEETFVKNDNKKWSRKTD
ncbi:hypothetical protein FQV26_04555 [Planococcus sp. CPCC 101016]|uniref:hypothetical protein n=1 Tax=Planococcus sp. CPCC 101016 TaxID=2599617 RepID=UPI0011B824F9|nr:hypothetical protein [Planococcus sp. CPCC 101016]TWT07088.1 hypothetical protein FQV26_04555 [Planococcus sp. CPCC 101016]